MMKFIKSVCCLVAITAMSLGMGEAQTTAPSTTTTSASSSDATQSCETAVGQCMSFQGVNNGCGFMSARLQCLSNTDENNCTIDSTMVTFDNLRPVFTRICEEIATYSSSCFAFLQCGLTTNLATMNTSGGVTTAQAAMLTSTNFWCTYTHQMIDCFLNNNVSCGFSYYSVAAIASQLRWLEDTCNGQNTTVNQHCHTAVKKCLKSNDAELLNCSAQVEEMMCLSRSRSQICPINESLVSFQDLSGIFRDVCDAVNPHAASCQSLRDCLWHTDFALTPGLNSTSGPPTVVFDKLLSTHFWCSHLVQVSNCFLKHGRNCTGRDDAVNSFDQTQLRTVCQVDIGNPGAWNRVASFTAAPVLHIALFLMLALQFNFPARLHADHHERI